MKIVEIQYRGDYFQSIEVPDHFTKEDIIKAAKAEMYNIDFSDGGVYWEPIYFPERDDKWEIIDQ